MANIFTNTQTLRIFFRHAFLILLLNSSTLSYGQLFMQSFNSGSALSNYVNASNPTINQFTDIKSTGMGTTVSVNNGALEFNRLMGNLGYFSRTVDFNGPPNSLIIQFSFQAVSATLSETTVGKFSVGSGLVDDGFATSNANEFASFGIGLTGMNDQFKVRNISTSTTNATVFSGQQVITWVMNKTGSTLTYIAPNGTTQTVANNKWDLWVGTTLAFDEQNAITSTQTLSNIKFRTEPPTLASIAYTLRFDNFYINSVGGNLASGTYTVGTNGNFQSITNAGGFFNVLNNLGTIASGGYTFQVNSDLTEYSHNPLYEISGMQADNPIKIVPDNTLRTVSGSLNGVGMIRLFGADYVSIDGGVNGNRFLRIVNTSVSSGSVITYRYNSQFNSLRYCTIEGSSTDPLHGNVLFIGEGTGTITNTLIEYCNIGSNGLTNLPTNGIYSIGLGANVNISNTIRYNNFYNFSLAGINLSDNNTNCAIDNNSFYRNTTVINSDISSIKINNTGSHSITNNYFGGNATLASGTWTSSNNTALRMIYIQNANTTTATTISGNFIRNLVNSSSATTAFMSGIHVANGKVDIISNTISNLSSASSNISKTSPAVSGILVTSGNVTIDDNVVHTIAGTNSGSVSNHVTGMVLAGATTTLRKNKVYNINNASDGADNAATGIMIHNGNHTLINNMISLGLYPNGTANSDLIPFIGIWNASTASALNLYYNTVQVDGENRQGNSRVYDTFCFYRGTGVTTPVQIMNNIFQNRRVFNENASNPKAKHYAIATDETANWASTVTLCDGVTTTSVDYNALYCNSDIRLARWAGSDKSFAQWQGVQKSSAPASGSGGDANSVDLGSINPIIFTNTAVADMHTTDARIDQKGVLISINGLTVSNDFDNELRKIPSDIGADEYGDQILSNGTGTWNLTSTWIPSRVPTYWNEVVIRTGHTVTIPISYLAQFYKLTVQTGATLILTNNTSILEGAILYNPSVGATGELTINNDGTFTTNNGIVRLAGRLTNNSTNFNTGSGTVFLNFDDVTNITGCALNYLSNLNSSTTVSDINGSPSITFYNLTLLNNASTSVLNSPKIIKVNNTLDILGSGTFAIGGSSPANSNTLSVVGTISTSPGTLTGGPNSNLEILGTTGNVRSIPVAFTSGFRQLNNLVINRQNAVDAIHIEPNGLLLSGELTLTKGHIATLSGSLLTLDVTATVKDGTAGGSNNSYVNGPMAKITNSTKHFSFPVGNVDLLGRIGISPTSSNVTTFTAQYFKQDPTPIYGKSIKYGTPVDLNNDLDHVSEREYWVLNRSVSGTPANGRVRLYWTTHSIVFPDPAQWPGLRVARHDGSLWESKGPTAVSAIVSQNADPSTSGYYGSSTSAGFVESNEVTNFSPFTLATTFNLKYNPLPVELLDFKAVKNQAVVNLNWLTTSEKNSDYFSVQRSSDGKNFTTINKVKAAGQSGSIRNYTSVDSHPLAGINYYRLEQVDTDGKVVYSKVVAVEFSKESYTFDVYPNPSDGKILHINFTYTGNITVTIYNLLGVELYKRKLYTDGSNILVQPHTPLADGLYIVTVDTPTATFQQKVIVK